MFRKNIMIDDIIFFFTKNKIGLIIGLIVILYFLLSFRGFISTVNAKVDINRELIRRDINNGPIIAEFKNVFSPQECDEIIAVGKKLVQPSLVGFDFGQDEKVRNSSHAWLAREEHPSIARASKLVSELTNLPVENQEKFQLVRYQKGQKYNHHFDACNPSAGDYKECIENSKHHGARKFTFLIYLNDVFYGGETDFPKVNMKIQPRKGSAVLFRNLIGNTRESDPLSLHAGLPPTQNEEKWIINVWTRDTLYDLYSS
jgi:prolyl 4-hydroxylase